MLSLCFQRSAWILVPPALTAAELSDPSSFHWSGNIM